MAGKWFLQKVLRIRRQENALEPKWHSILAHIRGYMACPRKLKTRITYTYKARCRASNTARSPAKLHSNEPISAPDVGRWVPVPQGLQPNGLLQARKAPGPRHVAHWHLDHASLVEA